jgi:general secretion pathway protein I
MSAADRAGGFTLLEVLVALAIAGLSLVVLFAAGGDGLVATDTATRTEEAVERAQSHLAGLGYDAALAEGQSEGDDGGGYRWRLGVAPAAAWRAGGANDLPAPATTLFDVEVAISWAGRDHDRSVVLRTRRLATVAPGR